MNTKKIKELEDEIESIKKRIIDKKPTCQYMYLLGIFVSRSKFEPEKYNKAVQLQKELDFLMKKRFYTYTGSAIDALNNARIRANDIS